MVIKFFKKCWHELTKPSPYDLWNQVYNRLQIEKKTHGMSSEYWRIWHKEVCPAYRAMTESHRKIGIGYDSLTPNILEDMDKPVSERKHF